jgi:hypothetical protein
MKVIESSTDAFDRITLCALLIERFGRSRLVPRALMLIGNEGERAAEALSQRARKRLADVEGETTPPGLRSHYLSDSGLDRFSRLHVAFDFNESTRQYVYDGKAYRDIVVRFPDSEEARAARERLKQAGAKLARRP